MTIETIHALTCLLTYQTEFPPAAGVLARDAGKKGGKILIAFKDREVLGLLILDVPAPHNYDVSYLYVKPEKRNQGVARALLLEGCSIARKEQKMIGLRVIEENTAQASMTHLAESLSFKKVLSAEIYRCIPSLQRTEENWNAFLNNKGQRLYDHLIRKGYRLFSFSQMSVEIRKNMEYKLERYIFPMFSNPFVSDKTDFNYSFVVTRGEEAIGFCSAESYGNRLILKSLAVEAAYQKKGPFLMPLIAFISKTIQDKLPLVCYTVYSNNKDMLSLSGGFLSAVTDEVHHQNFYRK